MKPVSSRRSSATAARALTKPDSAWVRALAAVADDLLEDTGFIHDVRFSVDQLPLVLLLLVTFRRSFDQAVFLAGHEPSIVVSLVDQPVLNAIVQLFVLLLRRWHPHLGGAADKSGQKRLDQ